MDGGKHSHAQLNKEMHLNYIYLDVFEIRSTDFFLCLGLVLAARQISACLLHVDAAGWNPPVVLVGLVG